MANMSVVIAIDVSASMITRDVRGRSRFDAIQEGTIALADSMLKISPEGLDLYIFGKGARKVASNIGPDDVADVFSRMALESRTDTHDLIRLVDHDRDVSKNTLLIIATDGAPSDPQETRAAIIEAAERCSPSLRDPRDTDDFTILFYQIGNDQAASDYLRELDDDLVGRFNAKFDIVDARTAGQIDGKNPFEVALEALED